MADDLEKQVAARKRQARERKIPEKIELVANALGKHGSYLDGTQDPSLCVSCDRGNFWLVTIGALPGKEVFFQRAKPKPEIEAYVPGEWERRLDELARLAETEKARGAAAEASRKEAERLSAEAEVRKRFGL